MREKSGWAFTPSKPRQFGSDIFHHRCIIVLEQLRLQTAADKSAQQDVTVPAL